MLQTVRRRFKFTHVTILGTVFAIALSTASAWGEKPSDTQPGAAVRANVSERLFAARTVFIIALPRRTAVTDSQDDETRDFAAGQVTAAVLSWRLYSLAPDANRSDLVFEVFAKEPDIRLVLRDPKTGAEIWTFARSGKKARISQNRHANFNRAVYELLDDVRRVAGPPRAAQDATGKTSASISAVPRVFLSSAGNEVEIMPAYAGWPGLPYNMLYAALEKTGRFELVMAPAQAELIFEIRYANPERSIYVGRSDDGFSTPEYEDYVSRQIKLVVWSSADRAVLLATTEYIGDDRFEQAMASLVNKVEVSLGRPVAGPPAKVKKPKERVVKDAPLPAQIGAAKSVFLVPPPNREIYNELCAALRRWGRYELVATAGQADLVMELQHDVMDRLVIVDRKTQVPLWELTVPMYDHQPLVVQTNRRDFLERAAREGNVLAAIFYGLGAFRSEHPAAPVNVPAKNADSLAKAFAKFDARIAGVTADREKPKDAKQNPAKPAETPARPD